MKAGKISYPGVGVAVGGMLGFIGVIWTWFTYSYPAQGGSVTVSLSGTADWTGSVALIASVGAFAFGGAYVLFSDPQIRRITGVLMGACSAFLLFMPLFGLARLNQVVGSGSVVSTKMGPGLALSFIGGVVAVVGTFLAARAKDVEEEAATDSEPEVAATA
jgi:hypothetical protein